MLGKERFLGDDIPLKGHQHGVLGHRYHIKHSIAHPWVQGIF